MPARALPDYAAFRDQWLQDVTAGSPSTTELGHRFARKLLTHWLDVDEASDDIVYCDGAGDGGIDIAYLDRGERPEPEGDGQVQGHTWFLVQSKYGSAFAGPKTLLLEAQKVIDTLDGKQHRLSSLAQGLLERLTVFRRQASELDRIVLVFGTVEPLSVDDRRTLQDVQSMGRARLGPLFDVECVSVEVIHKRMLDAGLPGEPQVRVPLTANLSDSGPDLLVGAVSLLNLYEFLKAYRTATGDLDALYEKNVRRFLGSRGKVHKAMQATIKDNPERFGLYNNGITLVATNFERKNGVLELASPFVVNGCQTTRTIWEVCHQRLDAGGTGTSPELAAWTKRAAQGVVVTKVVKVGNDGDVLLRDITRYTNTQNAVREKDFLTLTSDFRTWASEMAERYDVFLEVQRGGWDSQRAFQRQHPNAKQFTNAANAFDLLKVYGAGWLSEAGTAFGRNAAFLPNGTIFKRIVNNEDAEETFGVDDLYAAFRLQQAGEAFGFGRGAKKTSRRQTKFLFYLIALDLLRGVLIHGGKKSSRAGLTHALLAVFATGREAAASALLETAIEVIDEYMNQEAEDSIHAEPALKNTFNSDLNGYLKWEQLGKNDEASPNLRQLLALNKKSMARAVPGGTSARDLILQACAANA